MPDGEFLEPGQPFAEYNAETLQNPELRDLILPTLRADVEMHEKYLLVENDPLPVPITSLRGSDDQLVSAERLPNGLTATSREFELVNLAGGHMYLVHDADPILRIAQDEARAWQGAHGQPTPAR